MAVAAKTITINAAFLQEIKEDSQLLRKLLGTAGQLLATHLTHVPRKQLADLLGELRDQLALHFALEEAYGYFEDALVADPHVSGRAETLRSEHSGLFLELCTLEEQSERWLYHEPEAAGLRQLAAGFRAFQQTFLDHEARENDLILESLAEEIGDWE